MSKSKNKQSKKVFSMSEEQIEQTKRKRANNVTKYKEWLEPDNLLLITCWARNGLLESEIAHNMGITQKTLIDWKRDHKPIADALKEGREITDLKVENALLKRALGYDVVEEKVFEGYKDKFGKRKTRREITTRHIEGNVTAQLAWLNNRRPEQWKRNRDNFMDQDTHTEMVIKIVKSKDHEKDSEE